MIKKEEVIKMFREGRIKGYLPADIAALEIYVNNMGNYTGAVFVNPDKTEAGMPLPILNLDEVYNSIKDSEDAIEAGVRASGIVQGFLKNSYVPNIDFSELPEIMKDYNKISDRVYLAAVSPSYNNETAALYEANGMRFAAKMLLAQDADDSVVVQIPQNAIKSMGLTEKEFFTKVSENTAKLLKPEIRTLSEIFQGIPTDIPPEAIDMSMLVVTSENKIKGAASLILDDTVLSRVSEKYNGGNYFILPSSTNEFITMPGSYLNETAENIAMMTQMVEYINDTEVTPEEILSYDVYHYNAEKHKLEKATDYCINKQIELEQSRQPRADEELNEHLNKNDNIKL